MKRRDFIQAALVTGTAATLAPQVSEAAAGAPMQPKAAFEFYELRTYTLKNGRQRKLVEDYFQQAAIPALNRIGSKTIGVFTEYLPEGFTRLFALIPHASLADFAEVPQKLAKDTAYLQAAAPYLNATAAEPAYERIESSLFKSFAQMPALEVPEKKPRLFELRRYESPSETTGKKKIEMFNEAGEIAIFKRVGLTPVFFGEALLGSHLPNLTYMLVFDNMDEHDQNWKKFGSDPEWKQISSMPEYSDSKILSTITRTFLVPAAFSQV
jgi:hypothetical protein